MININKVTINIDNKNILSNISLNITEGRILGLLGPNGAGKSTLIKCLTGVYKPTFGEVLYDNEIVYENPKVKNKIGYVQDEISFFNNFKIRDIKKYYKLTYSGFDEELFDKYNKIFNIPTDKSVFKLSKGMKMRLNIILALSINAKYLILDEPTAGLDVILKRKLFEILKDIVKDGTTIIISSHHLNEIEELCDEIAIINSGSIIFRDDLHNINNKYKKLQLAFDRPIYEEDFIGFNDILKVKKIGRVFTVVTNNYNENLLNKLNSLNPLFVEEIDMKLEDVFIYEVEGVELYE